MTPHEPRTDWPGDWKERVGFIVLQHLRTLQPELPRVSRERLAQDLVLDLRQLEEVLPPLATAGLVGWTRPGSLVGITPAGIDYLEREARRRHSVRVFHGEAGRRGEARRRRHVRPGFFRRGGP